MRMRQLLKAMTMYVSSRERLSTQQQFIIWLQAALYHQPEPRKVPTVEYNIIYSITYGVPVLYLTLHDAKSRNQPQIESIYDLLVPSIYKDTLSTVGVLGSIGMTVDFPCLSNPGLSFHSRMPF